MSLDYFRAAYLLPDIASLVASFQDGDYLVDFAMQCLVPPSPINRDSFPHDEYTALAETVDPWLSKCGLTRLPRLFSYLDDMHMIMLQHAAYNGRVDVIQRALAIRSATPAMLLLLADLAAWNNQRPVLDYLVSLPHKNGWTCSSFALIAASREGHLDIVRFLHERFPLVPTTEDAMDMASAGGRLDVVRYLHAHRSEGCTTRAMDGAAKNGHLDVLQFLHANRSEGCTQNAMDWACEHGHLEVAQWLYEHRRWEGLTESAFNGAAGNNHFSVVEFLHHVVRAPSTMKAMEKAADAGHWAMVQWIHDHRPVQGWTDEVLKTAAARAQLDGYEKEFLSNKVDSAGRDEFKAAVKSADLERIKWLVNQFPGKFTLGQAMSTAVKCGPVKVVRWLLRQGVRLRLTKAHFSVLRWLIRHGHVVSTTDAVGLAARQGDLVAVEFFHRTLTAYLGGDVMDQAAKSGHLGILLFLEARSMVMVGGPETAFSDAVANGHFHVAQWLHDTYGFEVTRDDVVAAARRGDLVCMRWLLTHWDGGVLDLDVEEMSPPLTMLQFLLEAGAVCSVNSMDFAAAHGHLALLIKMHEFGATCSADAMHQAVINGHVDVVRWLFANRTEGCTAGPIVRDGTCWSSVEHFMVNEVVPVTPLAMIEAAQRGDLEVVEWLYAHGSWASRDRFVRQVDMTSVVAWAAHHPELDTAQWILNSEAHP